MGMSVGGEESAGGGGRRRRRSRRRPMSEINVTPFVDVMLVLLIIFMVTAPLLTVGVPIELPKTQAKQLSSPKETPLTITLDEKGLIYLQGAGKNEDITLDELVTRLKAIGEAKQGAFDDPIFVRGAKQINYGTVMQVMGRISAAGFKKVSLVTEVEDRS
jgi:biopolymer transport protein TolR